MSQSVGPPGGSAISRMRTFAFFLMGLLPQNYATVMTTDNARFNQLFHGLLERGVYIAPALYEAGFVSAAHGEQDIDETVAAAREIFGALARG